MKITFEWDETYAVGNDDIDEQHKKLFTLAKSVSDMTDAKQVKSHIMDLFKYTREHFCAEEQMMKQIGYPKLDEHKELHEELITKLSNLSTPSFDTDQSISQFQKFVYDWLVDHIMNHDKEYFHFNSKKNTCKV
jgi:hemerythrin